ncbi:MAG: LapA family protein [Pirellulales bacterium]|nr:LapA family protein [Thermoguttaceae bacterium]MDD4789690.1 LapA family protein [Pirellulales bacterium]NLZ02560.1 DUF1049 domain-containing protein [Pirellulaceae bacterium]
MGKVKLLAILILAAVVLIFVFQNTQSFEVKFLLFRFGFPGSLLLFAVFVVGFIVGGLVGVQLAAKPAAKK